MLRYFLISFIIMIPTIKCFGQIGHVEELKKTREALVKRIAELKENVKEIDKEIDQLIIDDLKAKMTDSSLSAYTIQYAKLKNKPDILGDIIYVFEENTEVLILGVYDSYFKVCGENKCGYLHQVMLKNNEQLVELLNINRTNSLFNNKEKTQQKEINKSYSNKSTTSYSKSSQRQSRHYIKGPRGGCYYINSNGNKTYVDRSFCN